MSFSGIPHAAVDFYAELEEDNTTEFWAGHRERYERDVREPIAALLAELEEEFGAGKVFRPQRNLRFSRDKTPYKTHQGGYVATGPRTGWYAEVSADGFQLGGAVLHQRAALLAELERLPQAGVPGVQAPDDGLDARRGGLVGLLRGFDAHGVTSTLPSWRRSVMRSRVRAVAADTTG